MKEYVFRIFIGDADCGTLTMEGKNEKDAFEKAQDYVANGLVTGLPNLDVPYSVEVE